MNGYADMLGEETLAIYLFHGVIERRQDGVRNYTRKHLEASHFREVVANLARDGTPVTIDDAVEGLSGRGALPPNAFVISFDDGFRNNYEVAAPILERLAVPAVFYLTSSFIDRNSASWTDLIEFAVETATAPVLQLPALDYMLPLASREQKVAALERIRLDAKGRPDLDPYELAEAVIEATGAPPFEPDPQLDAKMTWADVSSLAGRPLFTVGGHSHTHRIMSYLDDDELDWEVSESLRLLESAIGTRIRHYSYPEGLAHCYCARVIRCLRDAGIVACPSAEAGVNRVGDDLFRLRRVWVP